MFSLIRFNRKKFNWLWPFVIIILVSLLLLMPQILGHHMIIGEDCWFHMNRAYEDMEQIKTGHWSYFLNLFSFNSSGRIVNGFYGPVGSYLEGLLLLVAKTWYRWEVINSLLVLIIAGLSMFYVARRLNTPYWISIFAGIFYLSSFSFDRWVINQNFDGFGAMLLPWFLLAGYRIFRHQFNPIKLALLVAITSQLHLMSTVMGVISLLVSFMLANCYSGRLKMGLKVMEATGLCLLLTINVWGSLLEVKMSNYLIPTVPYRNFLSMHHAIYGSIIIRPFLNHVVVELIIFLALGLIWIGLRHDVNLCAKFFAVQSLVFFWLSTKYFPWTQLLKHDSMLASYLQFPERFLPIAIVSIMLLFVNLKPRYITVILLLLATFMNVGFDIQSERNTVNSQYHNLMRSSWDVILRKPVSFHCLESSLNMNDPSKFIKLTENRVPDYMPSKELINQSYKYYRFNPDAYNLHDVINNPLKVHKTVVGRDVEKLTFNAHPDRWVQLPLVKYSHTRLWLNHQLIKPQLNRINVVKVRPTQWHNVLEAQYQPSHWYELLVLIEIFSWFSMIIEKLTKYIVSKKL